MSANAAMSRGASGRLWAFHARGFVGSVLLVGCAVVVAFSQSAIPSLIKLEMRLQAVGWLLFVVGAGLRFWSTLYIGGRKAIEVVSEGPYSMCRNPLYLGTLCVALSFAIMAQSILILLAVLAASAFYLFAAMPAEEAALAARLGEPYREYCRRTPRIFPRPSLFRTSAELTVSVKALRNEAGRACRWIWAPLLAQLIVALRSEAWWPHWITLP